MDAEISAAAHGVVLEGALLGVVEDVARRVGEDDNAITPQVALAEGRRVLRVVDGKAMPLGEARKAATAAEIES